MQLLSNREGYDGYGEVQWEDGDIKKPASNNAKYESVIKAANSTDINLIFRFYNLHIDNRKSICPFPNHKGGKESSPSFYFYPETNSFYCFGCKAGTHCVDFVSNIENIGRLKAANKIIDLFGSDENKCFLSEPSTYSSEKNNMLILFSKFISDLIIHSKNDPIKLSKIEEITYAFDKLNDKYELDVKVLDNVINKLQVKLNSL